ncbi:hypothetical protein DYB37_007881 [Aphanomyces astaci]|uniref:Choline transporter-like protein n=2 Tax=Aphanomyces astaci TaxID=112090 RepID=A0A3R6WD29_APHAT|nr:hypothetical protein DYB34_012639 [Aphanomyces astaci]RHY86594.1 hypothetical protein DYB35_009056 [Aphanomyces astaci]RHZ30307.1 hypothetical protein DYB37_007881 [Aphanomyces astaci]
MPTSFAASCSIMDCTRYAKQSGVCLTHFRVLISQQLHHRQPHRRHHWSTTPSTSPSTTSSSSSSRGSSQTSPAAYHAELAQVLAECYGHKADVDFNPDKAANRMATLKTRLILRERLLRQRVNAPASHAPLKHEMAAKPTTVKTPPPAAEDSVQKPGCDLKEERSCNDIFFAILYLGCFGLVIALFAMYGGEVLTYNGDELKQKQHKYRYALQICAGIAGASVVLSMVWTGIMLVMGKLLIWIAAIVAIVGVFAAGVLGSYFMKDGGDNTFFWVPATLGTLLALILTIYVCCIRRRIAFASVNLKIACRAVLTYPVLLLIAFGMTIVIALWCLVWSAATYATMNHGEYILSQVPGLNVSANLNPDGYGNTERFSIFFGMLLVFFWTVFVVRNIVHVTVSGTVASWWYNSDENRKPMTSTTALCRAMTLSFGSICFGSFIVSVIETIKAIIMFFRHLASKSQNSVAVCLLGCLECIIGCISRLVQYFNKYAYSYVGIYGFSFLRSGKETWELFDKMGWSAIANDSLIDNVLMVGAIMVGFTGAAAGNWAVSYDKHHNNSVWTQNLSQPALTLGTSGFLIGFAICYIVMSVINSSVATAFVLFAEDPQSLQRSHPDDHNDLHAAWKEIYPVEYAASSNQGGAPPAGSSKPTQHV